MQYKYIYIYIYITEAGPGALAPARRLELARQQWAKPISGGSLRGEAPRCHRSLVALPLGIAPNRVDSGDSSALSRKRQKSCPPKLRGSCSKVSKSLRSGPKVVLETGLDSIANKL